MIFNPFGFLARLSRKVDQLPNKEKSKKQIQCMKADLSPRSKLELKKNVRRERGKSSFTSRHR